ncbi:MAG TPA: glycosyltransferase family 1 protein [Bacteroidales bacterium]|nr:glycosyltransferase family 1 protein [Bacteroidales bacterium]
MKLKIAFISEHASPLALAGGVDSGGQNIYVNETALELSKHGFEIDIFTRKDDTALPEIVKLHNGIRVIHIHAGPEKFIPKEELMPFMKEFSSNMIRFIRSYKITYELVHANFWMSGMVAMQVKMRLEIPFVITFHALGLVRSLYQKEADKFPRERSAIEKTIMQYADRIIAECPQDAEDQKKLYQAPAKNISIIPCGFNPDEFHPVNKKEARRYLKIPEDTHIMLQLGRVVPRKGIDTVIRSLSYLHDMPDLKLLVVGGDRDAENGPSVAELKRLKRIADEENVTGKVDFMGPHNHEELSYYYSAADVFVSTPWYEPFGITPVESMACGTPVIGSEVGGIKYTVLDGVTGLLVPPKNPNALAEKVKVLILNPAKRFAMGTAGIRRANDLFTWEKVVLKLQDIYNSLLFSKRKHLFPVSDQKIQSIHKSA